MPWQGSKSRVAEWVVGILPASHTLVDLFAGGCAVTHCALLSGKWERVVASDITDSVLVFSDAVKGEFRGFATVPTREEFAASEDTALRLLYSFGNDRTGYMWSPELEPVKVAASRMVSAPSMHERRLAYATFCRELVGWLRGDGRGARQIVELHGLEGLERLQGLEGLDGSRLTVLPHTDYRMVDIPDGATVYADPPYRGTANSSRYGEFDFHAFDQWLAGVDFPVYVSEFDAPEGCVEIASVERMTSMAANSTGKRVERIFVQERFFDVCRPSTLF